MNYVCREYITVFHGFTNYIDVYVYVIHACTGGASHAYTSIDARVQQFRSWAIRVRVRVLRK